MNYTDPPVDPYNPSYPDFEGQTSPLDQIIRDALFAHTLNLHVCLPAYVTDVLGNQKVNVKPVLQSRYIDAKSGPAGATDLPVIQQVPVSMPIGQNYSIKLPISVGDTGFLIFSDRSLDNWLSSPTGSTTVDPGDCRQHDFADAIFIPGLVPFLKQTMDSTPDMVLTNGITQLRISPSGGFAMKNKTTELIQNLINLVQTLSTASTVVGGPFIPSVVTQLVQIATNLQTLTSGE